MRSGVVAPLLVGEGSRPCCLRVEQGEGLRCDEVVLLVGERIVVLRPRVSESEAEGGGGRFARMAEEGSTEARQRKHSPVP